MPCIGKNIEWISLIISSFSSSSYQCFYMIKILLSYKIGAFFWHALPRMGKKLKIIMVRQLYNFLRKENE